MVLVPFGGEDRLTLAWARPAKDYTASTFKPYLVHFSPKALLQGLLDLLHAFILFQQVKMGKDTHNSWKAMYLTDI